MDIMEGNELTGDYYIEKCWGTSYDGDKYCNITFSWDDCYEEHHGDMDTLLRGMFRKADSKQKQILRIIMNEFRRHIAQNKEFRPVFDTKQNGDNHIIFWLSLKSHDKYEWQPTIKKNSVLLPNGRFRVEIDC